MPSASQMLDVLDAHRSQSWSTQDDLHLVLNHIALPEGDPTRRVVSGRSRSEGEKRMRQLLRALRTLPVDVASLVTAAHRDELPGLTATLARVRSSEGRRSIAAEGAGTNTKGDGASDEESFTFVNNGASQEGGAGSMEDSCMPRSEVASVASRDVLNNESMDERDASIDHWEALLPPCNGEVRSGTRVAFEHGAQAGVHQLKRDGVALIRVDGCDDYVTVRIEHMRVVSAAKVRQLKWHGDVVHSLDSICT